MIPTLLDPPVNYLHHGSALEKLAALDRLPKTGVHTKRELTARLTGCSGGAGDLATLIRGYGAKHSKKIDIAQFRFDLSESTKHRLVFASLSCRGFSYWVDEDVEMLEPLRQDMNLRIALMPGELLFYPRKVKRYLRRVNSNHCFCDGYPSIAFALGTKTPEAWFVLVMQSDLALRGPSYIRDHFRGWRKILFAAIARLASGRTRTIYLCRSEDVLRGCHSSFPQPQTVPAAWHSIYDQTAADFSMDLVELSEPVDTQIYLEQPPISTDRFYALSLMTAKLHPELAVTSSHTPELLPA